MNRIAQIIAGYIRYKNSTNCLLKSTLGYCIAALCYFILG
jgi:ammonia channel protein AmtB